MINSNDIIQYCLGKLGAHEEHPFGELPVCIKVGNSIFVELYTDINDFKITLRCEPDYADFLRQQYKDIIVRGYHCPPVQQPYKNTIYLNEFDENMLYDLIDHSYEQALSKMSKKTRFSIAHAIGKKELIERGAVFVENIQKGFSQYKNSLIEGDNDQLKQAIQSIWNDNGEDAYVDWYYGTLLLEEKDRIQTCLSERSIRILERYKEFKDLMYLPLDKELFELTMELNSKEALFCTYYFCKSGITVWGNYENKYPVFYRC